MRANAQLFVRLITKEMLYHSITVRLNNIETEAFLSPLYDLFISALSSIIPATPENIFIVNVQDDTDVKEKVIFSYFSMFSASCHNSAIKPTTSYIYAY